MDCLKEVQHIKRSTSRIAFSRIDNDTDIITFYYPRRRAEMDNKN